MSKWACLTCGYVWDGEAPPATCPKCGAPREKFAAVPDEKAKLIDRSRPTNDLLMKLSKAATKLAKLAENGIKEDLDPPCVQIFKKAQSEATTLRQMVKAEIQTHISKGKWG